MGFHGVDIKQLIACTADTPSLSGPCASLWATFSILGHYLKATKADVGMLGMKRLMLP